MQKNNCSKSGDLNKLFSSIIHDKLEKLKPETLSQSVEKSSDSSGGQLSGGAGK